MSKLAVRLVAATIAAAMLAIPTTASAAGTASSAVCRGQHAPPGVTSLVTIRSATLCLLNRERRARGLRSLRHSGVLARHAQRHSADMAARRYFSHTSASGASMAARLARAGYTTGRRSFSIGENIAWGTGSRATPSSIMRAWMRSPGHRANILSPRFREVGIGIVRRAPDGSAGATYTTDFGARA